MLGRGDGSGLGSLSLTETGNIFAPNVLTYDFVGAGIPLGDGVLTFTVRADLGSSTEFLTVDAEGVFSQNIFGFDGGEDIESTTSINLTQSQLEAMLADDGNITFTVTPSSAVNNFGGSYLDARSWTIQRVLLLPTITASRSWQGSRHRSH